METFRATRPINLLPHGKKENKRTTILARVNHGKSNKTLQPGSKSNEIFKSYFKEQIIKVVDSPSNHEPQISTFASHHMQGLQT